MTDTEHSPPKRLHFTFFSFQFHLFQNPKKMDLFLERRRKKPLRTHESFLCLSPFLSDRFFSLSLFLLSTLISAHLANFHDPKTPNPKRKDFFCFLPFLFLFLIFLFQKYDFVSL